MAVFFANGQFPSFKPIRTTGEKILSVIDAALVKAEGKDEEFLTNLKERATAEPERVFYFTKAQAVLVGIV